MVSKRLRESNVAMGAAREKEKGLTRFLQDARTELYGEIDRRLARHPGAAEADRHPGDARRPGPDRGRAGHRQGTHRPPDSLSERPEGRAAAQHRLRADRRDAVGRQAVRRLSTAHPTARDRLRPSATSTSRAAARSCSRTSPRCRDPPRTGWRRTSRSRRAARAATTAGCAIIATSCEGLDDPANARNVAPALAGVLAAQTLGVPPLRRAQAGHRRARGALRGQARAAARQAGAGAGRRGAGHGWSRTSTWPPTSTSWKR